MLRHQEAHRAQMTMPGTVRRTIFLVVGFAVLVVNSPSLSGHEPRLIPIAEGWARNQINAVIFRRNSVTTHGRTQYAAFYDADSKVVLARRTLGTTRWETKRTSLLGKTEDAHNSISIAVDGRGFLHVAWNHHNSTLQYRRSVRSGSLELAPESAMIGNSEARVTYPEFYNLPGGDLLFLYRDGASGSGNLILNRYDVKTRRWTRLQDNLIDGEGQRNAYSQMTVDRQGTIHLSWVWRETPDVSTNHDMCYAKSMDGGKSWRKTSGQQYQLPITAGTAEYVWRIPQGSELINQTSMAADSFGRPYIATYWRPQGESVPQYFVIYHDGTRWQSSQVTHRTTAFSLSGEGTRRIPISRPQIVIRSARGRSEAFLVFRDSERGSRVSVATSKDLGGGLWVVKDLTNDSVEMWEPTLDTTVWEKKKEIHLLVQRVGQGQREGLENVPAQVVSVLEWTP